MFRSRWVRALLVVLAIILVAVGIGFYKSGGIEQSLQSADGQPPQRAADLAGVDCERMKIEVLLTKESIFKFDVVGELCQPTEQAAKILQVFVSGAGYGSVYWDFPFQADKYSYARSALRAGYATFNFDRLGMGSSDHPFGLLLDVDRQAFVLNQLIESIAEKNRFERVVTLGHSFGSTISLAHALRFPDNVDGIVLTGFLHNSNPGFQLAMRTGVDIAAFSSPFAGDIIDPTYIISKQDSRGNIFYTLDNTDSTVVEVDELNRQTTSIGEVISMPRYFGPQSKELKVPAFILIGEDDFVVCGGALDCRDHDGVVAHEQELFPPEACLEVIVLEDTNHNANLHLNAAESFALMLDWVSRRVGDAVQGQPSQPCVVG